MATIMIAEDEQLERQALRYIIDNNCPELRIVGETGDGNSAVRIACIQKPDIVLMDIRMPELNGLEAAAAIREFLPDTIMIILTAFDEFNYARQALSVGAVEYLLKPVRPGELVKTLHAVVEKVESRKQKQREEAALRKRLEEARPFMKMSFVHDLVSGNIAGLEQLQERALLLGLHTSPCAVLLADIADFRQLTRTEPELNKQLIKQNVYLTICGAIDADALATPFGDSDILILLGAKTAAGGEPRRKQEILRLCQQLKQEVNDKLEIGLTLAVSRSYDNPLEMPKAYQEAQQALRQRFYRGSNQIIHIDDIPHLDVASFHYPFQYERTLLDKVRCGDRKQAKEAMGCLLQELFSKPANIAAVKAGILELLVVLSRAAVEGGASLERLTLLNFSFINQLMDCTDSRRIAWWLLETLDQFMDNMLENQSTMNARVINKACGYIEKNCHKNLSLEEVAQTVHLSPFYFSRLFKSEKGSNFVEFLTKSRINRAKRLLQNPERTVARIALEAGYQDPSYFCRVFRQEVGLTPNQYRQELRGKREAASQPEPE
ncbi:MAG: response regulator [Sporomusaceae bacterium]|nr:response regulator [Sporomusaceae bacterium]